MVMLSGWRGAGLAENRGDVVRHAVVDVADEAQGEMIILGVDPACARQPAAKLRQGEGDLGRDLDAGEQAWHAAPPEAC